jgi:hypothetical protein
MSKAQDIAENKMTILKNEIESLGFKCHIGG